MTMVRRSRRRIPAAVKNAANPRFMAPRLWKLLAGSEFAAAEAAVRRARLVAEKPDHRWTFHYQFDGPLPSVIGKVYGDPGHGRRSYATMCWLAEHGVAVPRPLGWVEELAMLAYLHVPGRMLGEQLFRSGAAVDMEQAAAWLFSLHRSALPLDRTFDVPHEIENIQAWAAVVAEAYPDHAWAADQIAERLADRAREMGTVSDRPIHKDFHHEHVFVGDRVHVIDLDEVRFGDPAYDLAHFCAYLRLQGCRFPAMASTLERRRLEFLDAYERLSGSTASAAYPVFFAYTCLKIAKQLCTSRGLVPRPEVREEHRQTAEILREGLLALGAGA